MTRRKEAKLMTKCMKCEESITAGEAWENQGLCIKCYKRFQLLEAINREKLESNLY